MKHYVAIPTVSNLGIMPHVRLLRLLAAWGVKPDFIDNFMPQWQARNEIFRRFVDSGAKYLTMIDCDTVPLRLAFLHFPEALYFKRVVAGHYAMHTDTGMFQYSVGKLLDRNPVKSLYQFTARIPEGWSSWDACGFGCVTFPRHIVEDLIRNAQGEVFAPTYNGVTEDMPVCLVLRDLGYEIVTHSDFPCEHWRTVDISKQLEIQNELLRVAEAIKP